MAILQMGHGSFMLSFPFEDMLRGHALEHFGQETKKLTKVSKGHRTSSNRSCLLKNLSLPTTIKVRLCLESGSHLQTATGRTWGVSQVACNLYVWHFVVLIASCSLHGLKMNDTLYI